MTVLRLRRFLPRSLFGRSLLIVVIPLLTLQAVTAYIFYEQHWQNVSRRLALGLAGDIALIADAIHTFGDADELQWLLHEARPNFNLYASFEPDGELETPIVRRASGSLNWVLTHVLPERISYPYGFDTLSNPDQVKIWIQLPEGLLSIVAPRKRLFSATIYVFLLWMVGTSIVMLGLAIYFLGRQVRPIRRLAYAAENFGKGVFVVDFKPEGAREVRQAANAFLRMRERIQRQISQRTEMLAGVSHDLRTPLTRMKLQLAMLDDSEPVVDLRTDISEMEKMVEGYLAFARGEGSELPVQSDLSEIIHEVANAARRKDADIEVDTQSPLILTLRRGAIKRALTNLVENADRYADHIWITTRDLGRSVELVIDDDGPGIPDAQRETAFKPFFRLEQSRNVETGGVGLGLTIARDVVRNHGGDLILEQAPTGGLRAIVRLPV